MLATGIFVRTSMSSQASTPSKKVAVASPTPSRSPVAEASPTPSESPSPSPSPEAPLVFKHPGSSQAAYGAIGNIPIFSSPGGAQTKTLKNPSVEGMQLVFGVKQNKGEWLQVQLPARPNGSTGWVRSTDVLVKTVPNHVVIELAKRKLSAFKGSKLLMETSVGVGTPKTPTPTGSFYVDFSLKNPGGPYGVHMLSVAAFSNVLRNFGGGVGQIAIHGTGNDGSVGQFSSNGCIRMHNSDVVRLARMVAPGTPVFIVA